MIEDHIDENKLLEKINILMEYRLFPLLFEYNSNPKTEVPVLCNNLVELQKSIYYLDAHLEAHWQTSDACLFDLWQKIYDALLLFDIDKNKAEAYVNHIRKYEKHELELRHGKSPLRFDMEYFYFYKSCDVKLLRRLIYETLELNAACGTLSEWRYYDLITEVNDDIEDIYEDLDFINGNRFLLSSMYHGKKATQEDFLAFIKLIETKAVQKRTNSKSSLKDLVFENTIKRVEETKNLLEDRITSLTEDIMNTSRLMSHMSALNK